MAALTRGWRHKTLLVTKGGGEGGHYGLSDVLAKAEVGAS
jgi:hypothetical protein